MNRRKYVELLAEALPAVITNEEEYSRMVAIVDRLAVEREPSVEEERLLELLSTLIEVYENEKYPIPDATSRDDPAVHARPGIAPGGYGAGARLAEPGF